MLTWIALAVAKLLIEMIEQHNLAPRIVERGVLPEVPLRRSSGPPERKSSEFVMGFRNGLRQGRWQPNAEANRREQRFLPKTVEEACLMNWNYILNFDHDCNQIAEFLSTSVIARDTGFAKQWAEAKNVRRDFMFSVWWINAPKGPCMMPDPPGKIVFPRGLPAYQGLIEGVQEVINLKNIPRFEELRRRAKEGDFQDSLEYATAVEFVEFDAFEWRVKVAEALDKDPDNKLPENAHIQMRDSKGNGVLRSVPNWNALNRGLQSGCKFSEYLNAVVAEHTLNQMQIYDKYFKPDSQVKNPFGEKTDLDRDEKIRLREQRRGKAHMMENAWARDNQDIPFSSGFTLGSSQALQPAQVKPTQEQRRDAKALVAHRPAQAILGLPGPMSMREMLGLLWTAMGRK
jgi:hypothetical protein